MFKTVFKNATPALVFIPLILTLIGLVFIFSADINANGTNNGLYLKQLLWIVTGLTIAYFIINIDYFIFVETSLYYYIGGLVLLLITLLLGKNIRGHKSWMGFAGLGIEPSEIMKVCYILYFAKYLANAPSIEKKNPGVFCIPGPACRAPFADSSSARFCDISCLYFHFPCNGLFRHG